MFCPSCGKQNKENVVFCASCGKALPQKSKPLPEAKPFVQANPSPSPKPTTPKKTRISFTAIKAVITGLLIVGLVLVLLQLYYPGIFPWN
jgi:uncharacterized membrane protein YvbJ